MVPASRFQPPVHYIGTGVAGSVATDFNVILNWSGDLDRPAADRKRIPIPGTGTEAVNEADTAPRGLAIG